MASGRDFPAVPSASQQAFGSKLANQPSVLQLHAVRFVLLSSKKAAGPAGTQLASDRRKLIGPQTSYGPLERSMICEVADCITGPAETNHNPERLVCALSLLPEVAVKGAVWPSLG